MTQPADPARRDQALQTTGIFRRKPIEADDDSGLERTIGLWQLTAIGLGAIIGAGIFALAGTVAKNQAGPAVSISFLIAGVASACAALSYAEFGGLIPRAGSAYTYGYAVLGCASAGSSAGTCCSSTPRSWPWSRSVSPSTSTS
jgi:amino acid permease